MKLNVPFSVYLQVIPFHRAGGGTLNLFYDSFISYISNQFAIHYNL